MEIVNQTTLRRDTTLLSLTHLAQLLPYAIGFGGLLVPFIIWLSAKNKVEDMDLHGRTIINFQLSLLLYIFISIPAILLVGLGLLGLLGVAVLGFVLPIINAVRAANGNPPSTFLTIPFI
ncbi:MAG: DUF4870 domain-containing protein [Bacteroidota bacterium]